MVIFNGFWAGFVSGFIVQLLIFTGYSFIVTTHEAKAKEQLTRYLENNDGNVHVKVTKGDLNSENNN